MTARSVSTAASGAQTRAGSISVMPGRLCCDARSSHSIGAAGWTELAAFLTVGESERYDSSQREVTRDPVGRLRVRAARCQGDSRSASRFAGRVMGAKH